jgi:general L-amino acid transport system substrate-binding protein
METASVMGLRRIVGLAAVALIVAAASSLALTPPPAPRAPQSTLAKVRAAGRLACGIVVVEPERNKEDRHFGLEDLDRAICRAVAVAALGSKARADFTAYDSELAAFIGVQRGAVDVVVGVTPGPTAAWAHHLRFGPPIFYDAQGVMVERGKGITSLAGLAGRLVCVIDGTETQEVLDAMLRARGIAYHQFPFQEEGEMDAALVIDYCAAVTADLSQLADKRASFHGRGRDFVILPETLSLDPAAPAYRDGDPQWAAIVDWTVYALVQAEASGITAADVTARRNDADPAVQRLLGIDFAAGRALGLEYDWAAEVIASVGNYGEIYYRTVGEGSRLRLPRGLNALWTKGGLMYPLPFR